MPTCKEGKEAYGTLTIARLRAMNGAMKAYRQGREFPALYGYRCKKHWHVTSRATWDGKRKLLLARLKPARVLAERAYLEGRISALK